MATIDLNHFSVFVEVARTSSFSEAAKRLGIPKSSVSRAIASLEQAMKVRLVNRTTRQVALSTAGNDLFRRIAPQLASLQSAICALPELEEQPRGLLRVTTTPDFASAVLAELIARFATLYPEIEVDLRLTNTTLDLVAEGIDVALRMSAKPLRDSTFTARKVSALAIQLFATPSYLARRKLPRHPDELSEHQWIVFRPLHNLALESKGEVVNVKQSGPIMCDDMSVAHSLVRTGAGICALPTFLVTPEVEAGELQRVLPKWNVPSGFVWFVCPSTRNVPRKVAVFRDFLLDALAKKPIGPI